MGFTKILVVWLILAIQSFAATYYIDYDTGSDANNGTAKETPWKHCPGMAPFSGGYTPAVGDRFIFKGGVTWPNAALGVRITVGGSVDNPKYYGVDETWYEGGAWTRPHFNAGSTLLTNHAGGNRQCIFYIEGSGASNVTIEGIEMSNYIYNDTYTRSENESWGVYAYNASNIAVSNCYIHDWVVQTPTHTDMGGIFLQSSPGGRAINNTIHGPTHIDPQYIATSKRNAITGLVTVGVGTYHVQHVEGNEIYYTTQGIWNGSVVKNNLVHDLGPAYGVGATGIPAHGNGSWAQGSTHWSGNTFWNCHSGVGSYFYTGRGSKNPDGTWLHVVQYVYNNVWYDTDQITLINEGNDPEGSGEIWFVNNVVHQSSYCILLGTTKTGGPFDRLVVQNNVWVTPAPNDAVRINDANDLGADYRNSHNVAYLPDDAAALGMTFATRYLPSSAVTALVDVGLSFEDYFNTDRLGVSRPQGSAWDIGPNERTGTGPVPNFPVIIVTAPAEGLQVTQGTPTTMTATATDVEDGTITANIVWQSSLDGALGTGGSISPTLSLGAHVITATIEDAQEQVDFEVRNVTVVAVDAPNTGRPGKKKQARKAILTQEN